VAIDVRLQPDVPQGFVSGGAGFAARVTGPVQDPILPNNAVRLRVRITASQASCAGTPTSGGRVILGTSGNDVLNGTGGGDVICGFGGDDVVRGRGGDDILRGGAGDDFLRGDAGKDLLAGATGRDRCVAGTPGFGRGDRRTSCELA
jgi:Ca2+-binding RTX toxin-like protein